MAETKSIQESLNSGKIWKESTIWNKKRDTKYGLAIASNTRPLHECIWFYASELDSLLDVRHHSDSIHHIDVKYDMKAIHVGKEV